VDFRIDYPLVRSSREKYLLSDLILLKRPEEEASSGVLFGRNFMRVGGVSL
jgi:hypothetical protein